MANTTNRACRAFISSFVALLAQKPFSEITIQDIITRSTYSRSSFYTYFKDKYELMQTLVDETAQHYIAVMTKELLHTENTESEDDRLYQIALATFRYVYSEREVFQLIFTAQLEPYDLEYFCRQALAYFKEADLFDAAPGRLPVDLDFYYYSTTWQFIHYISFWQQSGFRQTPEYLAGQVVKIAGLTKPGDVLAAKEGDC